jgi:ferredoxin-NADP reductase
MVVTSRECRARVVATRQLAAAVIEADLRMDDPPQLPFDAGQWISVPFGPKTVRAYTIASTPRDGATITLCADVAPGGIGSRWFQDLAPGDAIAFKGPLGGFVFDRTAARPVLFVAEEIGIVPIRSILADLDATGTVPPGMLIQWAPTPEGLVYREAFDELARRTPGFGYHAIVADGGAVRAVERYAPVDGIGTAYVAGGEATIKQIRDLLRARGLDRKAIRWERFW